MSDFHWFATAICSFLLTYLIHSTVIIVGVVLLRGRVKPFQQPALRVLSWKLALLLPLLTTSSLTFLPIPHLGVQIALSESFAPSPVHEVVVPPAANTFAAGSAAATVAPPVEFRSMSGVEFASLAADGVDPAAVSVPLWHRLLAFLAFAWGAAVLAGLIRLFVQARRLRALRNKSRPICNPVVCDSLARLARQMGVTRRIELLESDRVSGAFTAGVWHPFIIVQASTGGGPNIAGDHLPSDVDAGELSELEWNALLAHELSHIAHHDALWNLLVQIVQRMFPFQPLNQTVRRQIQVAMDFAADESAAKTLGEERGLVQCLIRLGDQAVNRQMLTWTRSGLVAGMTTFRSTLGQRVESLLDGVSSKADVPPITRLTLLAGLTVCAMSAAAFVPLAVAQKQVDVSENQSSLTQVSTMKPFSTLALLLGLTSPLTADEPQSSSPPTKQVTELKTTADPLPEGLRQFNGMLVGRLAAKDVEKGTFLVAVDAVPRVWHNSKAENPKAIVGKTVQVTGVFGKFLDVLVTTRTGETLEFECKHDGDALVFPGELLRKVAAYNPQDYPVLPEEFRGFRGAVLASVIKKDPETFELIIEVQKVTDVWKDSAAKQPESIVGKQMMLAGFWNRKQAYHNLKVDTLIEAGMQHIGRQSDHLTVAEFVRPADAVSTSKMKGEEVREKVSQEMSKGVRGFRGMLVGRLVKKDIERGTFTITVDAVPRVWKNNQSMEPKSLIGQNIDAEGVQGKMLDALVVARVGETMEFGALHDGGERLRVGEVLRKVDPVKPGDYPVLPDDSRGFSGVLVGKVISKDEQMWELIFEVTDVEKSFDKDRSRNAKSLIGKQVMLSGFWNRKDAYHSISVGDKIRTGVEHPQRLGDQLSVIEGIRKLDE